MGDGIWVKYGWELFDYLVDARSASLGNAGTAYNLGSIQSSMTNPSFLSSTGNNVGYGWEYDFSTAKKNSIILPAVEPSIFELKN